MSHLPTFEAGASTTAEEGGAVPTPPTLPAYFPATTSRPPTLAPAHLNGTQDMFSLFNLIPLYDKHVRPYLVPAAGGPDGVAGQPQGTPTAARTTPPAASGSATVAVAAAAAPGATVPGGTAGVGSSAPFASPLGLAASASSQPGGMGGTPLPFPLPLSDRPVLVSPAAAAVAADTSAEPKKPSKPPVTYAHYVADLAGHVKPPAKRPRAQKADRGVSLRSILMKPEYTPQRIVPFESEVLQGAFAVESGPVEEIDQNLLEPDEEEVPRRKKKKKKRDRMGAAQGGSAASTMATGRVTPASGGGVGGVGGSGR